MINYPFSELYQFIDIALKNRKYFPSTAANFRTALRLVEPELTNEEKDSIDLVKQHLEQIFQLLYSKYSSKLSAASLEIYRRRVRSLIEDYEKYGTDPSKMASWNREISVRKTRKEKKSNLTESLGSVSGEANQYKDSARNEISLGDGRKVIIITPSNLKSNDVDKIDAFITYLKTISRGNPPEKKDEGKVGV